MPSNVDTVRPRKKFNILWWIGGVFVLLVLYFVLQLFGPNPPIIVSPQTTRITEPLGRDGLPDYEQYMLDLSREGVTPDNNAAALLWQALFPGEVEPQQYAAMATELGLEQMPSQADSLVPLHSNAVRQQLAAWLLKQFESQGSRESLNDPDKAGDSVDAATTLTRDTIAIWSDPNSPVVEEILEQAMTRPWTSAQLPPLADWVRRNQQPLDLMVEASTRPRFYAPSPTLIDNQPGLLFAMLLPLSQSVRETGRSLPARAMWHLGEGRTEQAWQDLLAVHRLSRLFAQGHSLVEQLVGFATSYNACDRTVTLLHHGQLNAELARQVADDLATIRPFTAAARSLDQMERMLALNAFIGVAKGGGSELFSALSGVQDNDFGNNAFNVISVDWNVVLLETNRWYDRLAQAAKLSDRPARAAEFAKIEADMRQLVTEVRVPGRWLAGVVSRHQRSELVSSVMLGLFLPAVNAAMEAQDRANATFQLTRLAAALAVYRAEHGAYPPRLEELVPGILPTLPVDLYNAKPFVYKRDGEGYLLYSLGENGTDDGGSNEQLRILNGRPIDELDETQRQNLLSVKSAGTDDLSIRVPRPAFELPRFDPTAAEP
jgi:hypothetical protein